MESVFEFTMTTTGTYNDIADFTIANFIDEAFRRLKIDQSKITSEHLSSAKISLQLMFVDWYDDGTHQFLIDQQQFNLVGDGSDIAFQTPNGTIDIMDMIYRDQNGNDLQIKAISRQDYLYINDKFVEGQPLSYFTDKTTIPPVVRLWPVQNIAGTSVIYNRFRQVQDVGPFSYQTDTTVLYANAICAGLAARLAEKYASTELEDRLIAKAQIAYDKATDSDRDRAPYVIKPRLGRRFYYGV